MITQGVFWYVRPDEMFTLYQTVTGAADPEFDVAWLCDGRMGRPVKGNSGTETWGITGPAMMCDFVAAFNHNVDDGNTIEVTGDLTASLVSVIRKNGISRNPFKRFDVLASVDSLSVTVTGNSQDVIIGEFIAARCRELGRPISRGGQRTKEAGSVLPDTWSSIPGYSIGQDRNKYALQTILTQAQMDALDEWHDTTDNGTKPSVIVRTPSINQASMVRFVDFSDTKNGPDEFHVTLNLIEFAGTKW